MAGKVLLVQTDQTQSAVLGSLLQTHGYTVLTATDGEEGWAIFQQDTIQGVVSAIRMPNLDGLSLLKRIRAHSPETPVVLLAPAGHSDAVEDARESGATAVLFLPLQDATELVRWLGS